MRSTCALLLLATMARGYTGGAVVLLEDPAVKTQVLEHRRGVR